MKNINKTTAVIAISTLAIGLLLGWIIFGTSNENQTDEHKHTAMADSETIWTCSMHPQIRKNEPGDCPICGMDLIPLESTDGELDPMAVSMSPTAMQLAQVQTMVVDKGKTDKSIRLNGKVQADERLLSTQSSHIPGRIEKLSVNFTGEFVSAGQVLANVYSPELVTAQEELFEAKKIKETQPALFNAAKEKLKNWKLTDKQIDQIVTSNKTILQFPILANVSGYVTKKMVNLGDYIKQGEALYEIADLSKVWVLFDVYESDMTWINKGDAVIYTVQSIPGKTFKGKISYIDPVIDPKTRVAKARLEAANKGFMLKPEMFATGTIETKTNTGNSSLTIPKTAVMWTGKRSVVYVMQMSAQGVSFILREVTLGPELGESYVIEEGLQLGEEIAVNGTFSIDAAAQLAGKPSMMSPEGGAAMTGHDHGVTTPSSANQTDHSQHQMNKLQVNESKQTYDSDPKFKEQLQVVFSAYLPVKDALIESDVKTASKEAGNLKKAIDEVDMKLVKDEAHMEWMKDLNILQKSTEGIRNETDLEKVRMMLSLLSDQLFHTIKKYQVSVKGYRQYCPMAFDNKGAFWLSDSEKILNPYFGDAMLTCGNVEEHLNETIK